LRLCRAWHRRKAWLFVGSDDHAQATGKLLTLIASARLHRLDPEAYLRDLLRIVPHWPRDRYLELAPRYWLATRARLDAAQVERELGPLDIPAPAPSAEQPAAGWAKRFGHAVKLPSTASRQKTRFMQRVPWICTAVRRAASQ
jgi:hypothetical protein